MFVFETTTYPRLCGVFVTVSFSVDSSFVPQNVDRALTGNIHAKQLRCFVLDSKTMPREVAPVRLLVVGPYLSFNLGGPSVILGIQRVLCKQFASYDLILANTSPDPAVEKRCAEAHGIKHVAIPGGPLNVVTLLPRALFARCFGISGKSTLAPYLKAVREADAIISACGILFADQIGIDSCLRRFVSGQRFGVAKLFGKHVVQYTADFGPFKLKWNRFWAKFWLGRCVDLLVCRNEESRKSLRDIGIPAKKMLVAPDTGFAMRAAGTENNRPYLRKGEGGLVAIGVSHQVRNRFPDSSAYDTLVVQLAKKIIGTYKCHVILFPNEVSKVSRYDDMVLAQNIEKLLDGPAVTVVQSDRLTGPEMKALVGRCDAVVSSRYHTLVASLSMHVPSIAIGWHRKYKELFSLFGMADKWVFDYSRCSVQELISAFDRLWLARQSVRRKLVESLPAIEKQVYRTGAIVANQLEDVCSGRMSDLSAHA
jgi:polysaccharide pyruvyl transferase WcaK-like protein